MHHVSDKGRDTTIFRKINNYIILFFLLQMVRKKYYGDRVRIETTHVAEIGQNGKMWILGRLKNR